jgi:large subunit ribosomal protein L23
MVCIGKKRVRGSKSGMIVGKTSTYKKAIVQLPVGEAIDFYSNI